MYGVAPSIIAVRSPTSCCSPLVFNFLMANQGLRNAWTAWSRAYNWYLDALANIADEPLHPTRVRLSAEVQGILHVLQLLLEEIERDDPQYYEMLVAEDDTSDNDFDPTNYGP